MQEIGYRSWGMIPADPDPSSGEATIFNPPMLTTLALDPGASLVFEFDAAPGRLHVSVEVTAITAEGRGSDIFRTFTGPANGSFREASRSGWDKAPQGLYVAFSADVEKVEKYLKLALTDASSPLVINRITFLQP